MGHVKYLLHISPIFAYNPIPYEVYMQGLKQCFPLNQQITSGVYKCEIGLQEACLLETIHYDTQLLALLYHWHKFRKNR